MTGEIKSRSPPEELFITLPLTKMTLKSQVPNRESEHVDDDAPRLAPPSALEEKERATTKQPTVVHTNY